MRPSSRPPAADLPDRPPTERAAAGAFSPAELDLERRIEQARYRLVYGKTTFARRRALEELADLESRRTPNAAARAKGNPRPCKP